MNPITAAMDTTIRTRSSFEGMGGASLCKKGVNLLVRLCCAAISVPRALGVLPLPNCRPHTSQTAIRTFFRGLE
jgi:hypothetical protein